MEPLKRRKARASSLTLLALTVAVAMSVGACSKPDPEATESTAATATPESAEKTSQDPTNITQASDKKKPSPTLAESKSATPSPKARDPQSLTTRNPEDFIAPDSSNEYVTTYAVDSPDGGANCYFMDKPGQPILTCVPDFIDPPLVITPISSQWEAVIVHYDPERGFYAEGDIKGSHPPASYTVLNPNETVSMGDITFSTDQSGALKVAVADHFMVFDNGSYAADNYPPQRGAAGSKCGEVTFQSGNLVNIYATADNTDCDSAVAAMTKYADPSYPKQGNRGYATIDGWECVPAAPSGWSDIPQNRLVFCTRDEQQVVTYKPWDRVVTDSDPYLIGPFKTE